MTDDGLLVVDKPAGWTSHDVVARARRLCGTRRVGHAGTLDPMATGVLVLGVNRATKLLTFLVGCDKTYLATVRLGQSTVTDDAEGDVLYSAAASGVEGTAIDAAVARLTGPIEQVPSRVSAIKVDGKRSYARVRGGEDVTLAARPVTVHRFEVLDVRHDGPYVDLDVEVEVSSGTYVRALARDLGGALGVGGHLTALRRTRVGRFDLAGASTLDELGSLASQGGVPLLPMAAAARAQFPVHDLTPAEAVALGHGQRIASADPDVGTGGDGGAAGAAVVAAIAPDGSLVAILDETRLQARAHVVLAPR
ncbi:tRNA pseudouridine(55) synthase TruB [Lapillicoccus sp.]|uniref:tRNA pseudouridine(55) synthase TruB n=1 Tax=Lapillicoccus sp. TaxID=1909287 RepID=UPI003267E757